MVKKELVLMHLSDIHFASEISGTIYDLDEELRNELERDAVLMLERFGRVDGILVSGDIAYAGKKKEFDIAADWLSDLCEKLKCRSENVYVVPGNHDVDRAVIANSLTMQNNRNDLRRAHIDEIDDKIMTYIEKDVYGKKAFIEPLSKYNTFAARFGCELNPKPLYWDAKFILNDDSTLRVRGLNSVLVSDASDSDDGDGKLIVGSAQVTLLRKEGVEYLTLCHHPPDWLKDKDRVENALNNRARIQLYGHKHDKRIERINDSVRIIAGATHPSRTDDEWFPAYNFITVYVDGINDNRKLNLSVYPRVWCKDSRKFKGDFDSNGFDTRSYVLPIDTWMTTVAPKKCEETVQTVPIDSDGAMHMQSKMNPARRLTYRFLSLPYLLRIKIATELELLTDEYEGEDMRTAEFFQQIFRRAREMKKLGELWDAVEAEYGDNTSEANPYS